MSTRLHPWGSGAVEMAIRKAIPPDSVGLALVHPLTTPPAMRIQPSAGLGPGAIHPTHSGVGRRVYVVYTTHGATCALQFQFVHRNSIPSLISSSLQFTPKTWVRF